MPSTASGTAPRRTRQPDSRDYAGSANPPVLHQKDAFLHHDHPTRDKFARLARLEEERGLLSETASIGTREGWEDRLRQRGFRLLGHRLVRRHQEAGGGEESKG